MPALDIAGGAAATQTAPSSIMACNFDHTVNWWFELTCVGVALAMLVAAETYWAHTVRQHPHRTIGGAMQSARRSWVSKHLGSGMLPVNTIRDFMKAAEFMGRTSVVVVFAVASYAISISEDPTGHGGPLTVRLDRRFLLFLKLVSLLSLHSFNFVAFTQAVRYLNHVNFLINAPSIGEQPITEEVYLAPALPLALTFALALIANRTVALNRTLALALTLA